MAKKNVFDKPNEQSDTCINSAMARKGRMKSNFSIELPKGGMSNLTKQVRSQPVTEPPADATEWQRFTHYLEEFKNVSEHGECVWLFKDVKREIDRIKFESDSKLSIRQLANAMILAFIKEHNGNFKDIHSE